MTRPLEFHELPAILQEQVREKLTKSASASPLQLATDAKAARAWKREQRRQKYERDVRVLTELLRARGIEAPTLEVEFAQPDAAWRFDLAWPARGVALEIDGGAFIVGGGRHGRGAGMREDIAKRNAALILGWRVVHVLPERLASASTADLITRAIEAANGRARPGDPVPSYLLADRRSQGKRKPTRKAAP